MKSRGITALAVVGILLVAGAAQAAAIYSDSFEDPARADGVEDKVFGPGAGPSLTGWTLDMTHSAGNVPWQSVYNPAVDFSGQSGSQVTGSYVSQQDLAANRYTRWTSDVVGSASIGVEYTLSVDAINANSGWGTASPKLHLFVAGTKVATANITANATAFSTSSVAWTADSAGDIVIKIVQEGSQGTPAKLYYDNVVLVDDTADAPIPEPATMSLLALGGLGALIRRKRS